MFQKLKISSAKKYIENSIYDHRPKAVRQIDKLGVILDEKVLSEIAYDQLKKAFSSLGNKVEMILFSEKTEEGVLSFKRSDLGWKGVFKSESAAAKFQQEQFDVLVNYFETPQPELILLGVSTSAKIKVGFSQQDKKLNDLQINVSATEVGLFIKELKKYLAIINQ
ncbi:hypothetical protein [Mesonia sp.]|uniref:DUF6913 domain-containing protein n=1 Tax=Mesonia sp. TaxID=1960830 RepID=UPI001772592B|nr:hypothetical protein [Mesonia sp.]HIB36937.1 hypothetical protein [Mesonia sp.]HIO26145.1 hypothetical protein [Flavobacteriaceae bacterium]